MVKKIIILLLIIAFLIPSQPVKVYAQEGSLLKGIICLSLGIWGLSEKPKSRYVKWSSGYLLAVGTVNLLTVKF